ncbi:helix-turn-helix domain-containing protein [Bosea sp. TWI1241]|uniref:helix-turn-helix domain-containing protein n=1 Tax=Bosea sp. TWI1241 TaxID=3148904 RepID=UPI003208655B
MVSTKSDRARNAAPEGWHPADIVAAVHKRGTHLKTLAQEHGFNDYTMSKALRLCFPACHDVLAAFIGAPRQEIWPQFYDVEGNRLSAREQRRRQKIAERSAA